MKFDNYHKTPCLTVTDCDSNSGDDGGGTVVERSCVELNVYPASGYTSLGGTAPFTATLIYSDGTSEDVTSLATWTSSGVGTVSDSGSFSSEEEGIATVNAAYCDLIGSATVTIVGDCFSNPVDWVVGLCRSNVMTGSIDGRTLLEWQYSAAKGLIFNLNPTAKVGVVSYAGVRYSSNGSVTYSKDGELESGLTLDLLAADISALGVNVHTPCLFPDADAGPNNRCTIQIAGALQAAWDELRSSRHQSGAARMMVIFAFGQDAVVNTEATELADQIKAEGIRICVIGLNIPFGYVSTLVDIASCGLYFPFENQPELMIEAAQRLPQMICYGYGYSCYNVPTRNPDIVDPPTEAANLAGLRWELPCSMPTSWIGCPCNDPDDQIAIMGGTVGVTYDVTLRFRGIIELKGVSGGTWVGPLFANQDNAVHVRANQDGTPIEEVNGGFNRYSLIVSNPSATFWLNAGQVRSTDATQDLNPADWWITKVDYTITIQIVGGATVTLRANSSDGAEFKNIDFFNFTIPEIPPYNNVYSGQFLEMDVVSVTPA